MYKNWSDKNGQFVEQIGGHYSSSRRTTLKFLLGVGYASCTLPSLAQSAIHTQDNGLESGTVIIHVNGFEMPAFRSAPKNKTNLPIVIVIQEIFGVHEYIADITRRLAQLGYLAIAPDLYRRQGDATKYTDIQALLKEVVAKVPDAQVIGDLDATVDWAVQHGGDINKLAVTGFCWGGRQTWLYAAHQPKVKAAVAWYGKLVGDKNALTPQQPVDIASQLHAPVLGLYGELDQSIPLTTIQQMEGVLQKASEAGNDNAGKSKFNVYPNAGHAFHADYRPSYHQPSAVDGWDKMLGWFKTNGVI